jgi:hypothetical protein
MKNKRITVPVNQNIDEVKDHLLKNTGIRMSYIQVINYLIHFYMKHAAEPVTQWRTK